MATTAPYPESQGQALVERPRWGRRLLLTSTIVAFMAFLAWSVAVRQALLFVVGVGMGSVLAGARFGFTTAWRNFIEQRDPSGVLAQLLLLALPALISFRWLPRTRF